MNTKRKSEFTITPFSNPGGSMSYRVSGSLNGKRIRENFDRQDVAVTRQQSLEREAMNIAPLPLVTCRLSDAQISDAEHCFRLLSGRALTLQQAVEFAITHFVAADKQSTVASAYTLFYKAKQDANKSTAYLATLKARLKKFVAECGTLRVNEILADRLRGFIIRDGSSLHNRNSDYRAFTNFFNWCHRQEFIARSPLDKIEKIAVDLGEPVALALSDCRLLMYHAEHANDGAALPFFTVALFCALRPQREATLTAWDRVLLDRKMIRLRRDIVKTGKPRNVDIPDNAVAFLEVCKLRKLEFNPPNLRKFIDEVKALAGFATGPGQKEWTPDVLRHTGISAHVAQHENIGKTAKWAGNSIAQIGESYDALLTKDDAQAFYSILPGDKLGNIVNLKAA